MATDMTYEDFVSPGQAAVYKYVKGVSMRLGPRARQIAAEMVGGHVATQGYQHVRTDKGLFCLVTAHNSMNTTARNAADRIGAKIVVMGDPDEMGEWFREHGLTRVPYKRFRSRVNKVVR